MLVKHKMQLGIFIPLINSIWTRTGYEPVITYVFLEKQAMETEFEQFINGYYIRNSDGLYKLMTKRKKNYVCYYYTKCEIQGDIAVAYKKTLYTQIGKIVYKNGKSIGEVPKNYTLRCAFKKDVLGFYVKLYGNLRGLYCTDFALINEYIEYREDNNYGLHKNKLVQTPKCPHLEKHYVILDGFYYYNNERYNFWAWNKRADFNYSKVQNIFLILMYFKRRYNIPYYLIEIIVDFYGTLNIDNRYIEYND